VNERSPLLRNIVLLVAALVVAMVAAVTINTLVSPEAAFAKYSPTCGEYRCDAGGGNKSEGGPPGADRDPGKSGNTKAKGKD